MRRLNWPALVASALLLVGLALAPIAGLAEEPQRGGTLKVSLSGDPPSLDMHQENTFLVDIPMSTVYNTLVVFDPHGYPNIIGDLAKSWEKSEDGKTWTFKLHEGVKFHDGTELTSADVKASWDRMTNPPEGVTSPRRTDYAMIDSVDAPDKNTVIFHLKYPAASFLKMLAHPANFIYAKADIDKAPDWHKKNTNGTGPFKLAKYTRGSSLEVMRNPNYFKKDLPYMDGIKYFMIKDLSASAKSVRSGRTDVEFRGFPPAEVEAIQKQLGDKVVVRYPKALSHWGVAINVDKKPFDDERVRKALGLALNRYDMAKTLKPLSGLETVGSLMHPDSEWGLKPEEMHDLAGFNPDHEANIQEAKKLLAEAGYPDGFKTILTNRSIKLPYIDMGVYLVSAWKKIGVNAEHKVEESATWTATRRNRDFELFVDPFGSAAGGDPDEMLSKFLTGSSDNWGRFSDPEVDALYKQQQVELDEQKRIELVKELQRKVIGKSWWLPGLWWTRIEVRSAKIKNYEPLHSHWMNRRLEDVWLAQK